MDRLALLRQMADRTPGDPFPRYGLAMELKKQGDEAAARAAFDDLVDNHPTYVPTYLMYGGYLQERGDLQAAAKILDRGIAAARDADDAHALSELEGARAELS
jgi:tetratricopeptide (TPR) repeat protein